MGMLPKNNTELHIYVFKASSVIPDNFLPSLEQFSEKQITTLFHTVNGTLHPFNIMDNKAEHVRQIQMENVGSRASCCEIFKRWVTDKGKIKKHQKGKEKGFQMEKDERGRSSKGSRPQCAVYAQDSVLLNASDTGR